MSTAVLTRPADVRPADGGAPARRAVVRWAWRLFRREWRQQFLIFALITVAVAGTIVGSAVATTSPQPSNFGFGSAQDAATFSSVHKGPGLGPTPGPQADATIARLEHRFGQRRGHRKRDPIDPRFDQHLPTPGPGPARAVQRTHARAPFRQLSVEGANEVAVTSGVASSLPPQGRGHLASG